MKNTPVKKVKRSWLSKHPWLKGSRIYEESYTFKIKARKNYLAVPTEANREIYKRACLSNSNIYEEERNKFLERVMDETKDSSAEFFSMMKSCNNSKKDTPESMLSEGVYVKGNSKMKAFCKQLGSCFLQDVPLLGQNFEDINDQLLDIYNLNFSGTHTGLWDSFNLNISLETVVRMIGELNNSKDPGPMKISAAFLKFNVDIVAPITQNAINAIMNTGRIPDTWKVSYITPIPKKGSVVDISNYRGIAMQSCIPKILDKFITELLNQHLGGIISKNQHGFMKNRSTTTNLLEITQFLHENAKDAQIDVIYLDYSKAFDHIRHDLLASKLSRLSMPYNFYRIVMNFVIGRKYLPKVDNIETKFSIEPKSSVPQGSHSGPMLYILFTNDVGIDQLCFADDSKVYQIFRNMNDRNSLQNKLNRLEKWATENGLTLNPEKTYHMSFGRRMFNSIYFLKNRIIKEVELVRDLGVYFDRDLTFKYHIKNVIKRSNQMIGAARRFVTGIKHTVLIARIYAVYIQPVLEYGSIVWNQNKITLNNGITLAHKKVTRIALNVYYNMEARRYIPYEKRCEILSQDGPLVRRHTQAANFCLKIIKDVVKLSFGNRISEHVNTNFDARVFHLFLRTDNNIPPKSPMAMMLFAVRKYESVISLTLEIKTNAKKIKEFNERQRTIIADSRGSIQLRG